jgi:hypothetical protein
MIGTRNIFQPGLGLTRESIVTQLATIMKIGPIQTL